MDRVRRLEYRYGGFRHIELLKGVGGGASEPENRGKIDGDGSSPKGGCPKKTDGRETGSRTRTG